MASLSLRNIYKYYQNKEPSVSDFNLEIKDKEFIVLVGPSGCGKSTTLRMIAGLEEISAGELYIDGKLVNNISPKDRDIAMVFQNYALYPHMSVYDNMAFGLKLRKKSKEEIKRKVEEAAVSLDITHLLKRKPKALSGGQRQRVALGRAIVREPKVFLLDEPLSNLDAKLRAQMRTELTQLHQRLQTTFIYVTHDQTEAMTMGDRIVAMKDGVVQQVDTPQNLYEKPVNVFVASFIGSPQMNFVDALLTKSEGSVFLELLGQSGKARIKLPASKVKGGKLDAYINKQVIFGIRPENIHDDEMFLHASPESIVDVNVEITELLGAETYLYLKMQGIPLTARVAPRSNVRGGEIIPVAFDTNKIHLFDKKTELAILN